MMITKKPKIAILSIKNSYNYGGVLSSLKVVHQFCKNYFEPKVFFVGFDHDIATSIRSLKFTSSVKSLSYFGMDCMEIGARWAFWEPGHYAYTLTAWEKALQGYDYIFVVSGTDIAAHPAMLLNKKYVMWIGTPYMEDRAERVKELSGVRLLFDICAQKRMRSIEKKILTHASDIMAISSYAKAHFLEILGSISKNIEICGFPVESTHTTKTLLPCSVKMILAVGRFSDPRKNIDMLIRAFAKINTIIPDSTLNIVGKKPPLEKILSYKSLACFEKITFIGQVAGDDLQVLYRRASILLITSHQEGLAIVGLEALLNGVPVISTDCGGPRDYVINDVTGYLVPLNDDEAMAHKAAMILQNPHLQKKLSLLGRQFVAENYSKNKAYSVFKSVLSKTYPELYDWFFQCDRIKALQARKKNIYRSQDIL